MRPWYVTMYDIPYKRILTSYLKFVVDLVFCLVEVRAMVVALQCTAILTMCIVEHRPPPCAVTIHNTCTNQRWNRYQDSAASKI